MLFFLKKSFLVYLFSGSVVYGVSKVDIKKIGQLYSANKEKNIDLLEKIIIKEKEKNTQNNNKSLVNNTQINQPVNNPKRDAFLKKLKDKEDISKLEKEIVNLGIEISIQNRDLENANKIKVSAIKEYNEWNQKSTLDKKLVDKIRQKIIVNNTKREEFIKEIDAENIKISEIEKKIDNYRGELEIIKISNTKLNDKKTKTSKDLKSEKEKLKKKEDEISKTNEEKPNKEKNLSEKQLLLSSYNSDLNSIKSEIQALEQKLSIYEEELVKLEEEISSTSDSGSEKLKSKLLQQDQKKMRNLVLKTKNQTKKAKNFLKIN